MAKLLKTEINGDLSVYDNIDVDGDITLNTTEESSIVGTHPNGEAKAMLSMSSNGNTVVGYGNYEDDSGNTHIYGEEVKIYTKDTTVKTNGAPFGIYAVSAGCSTAMSLTTSMQKIPCENEYSSSRKTLEGVLEVTDGGVKVLRDGRYLISAMVYAYDLSANSGVKIAITVNDSATASVLTQAGAADAVTATHPMKVLSLNKDNVITIQASSTTGTGKVAIDNKTLLTVMAIE